MKFFISLFFISLTILNAYNFDLITASSYSGYTRGGEVKRHKIKIPAGYKMNFHFHTPTYTGVSESRFRYAGSTLFNFNEQANFRFTNLAPSNANDVNFQFAATCNYPAYVYLEFSGYTVGGHYNHFDYNVQFYPLSGCNGSSEPESKPEDLLPKLHVEGQSISSSVTKGEFKKYKLQGQKSGKVDIIMDNLSDDVDLYVRKNGMVGTKNHYYNCRPYYGGTRSEVCTIDYIKGKIVTIGVSGYKAGSYRLAAQYNELMDISVSDELSGQAHLKTWRNYIVKNHQAGHNLIAQIKNLSADVDLYVKKGSQPTSSSYDCRPYYGGTRDEMCKIKVNYASEKIYISVHGYRAGSYNLSLKKAPVKTATILLHGLASSSDTWKTLNLEKYDKRCVAIPPSGSLTYDLKIKGREEYCYTVDFGKYDRNSGLKDLRGNICPEAEGCRGDYSTFDTLGREVSDAVSKVRARLGSDVAITLVGHSRGGVAATAYLGGNYPYKSNVKALLTTGTPFLGSPLGKIYTYLKKNCISNHQLVNVGSCKQDGLARTFIKDQPHKDEGLDVIVPSVGFLVKNSSAYNAIYTADRIQAMQRGRRIYHNLVYSGIKLGDLLRIGNIAFNPFPSIPSMLASTIGENFSVDAETYILGTWLAPHDMVLNFVGDGIVPENKQDISGIISADLKPYFLPGRDAVYIARGFNSRNRNLTTYRTNTVHIEEPKQVSDLSQALDTIEQNIIAYRVPNLHEASMQNSNMLPMIPVRHKNDRKENDEKCSDSKFSVVGRCWFVLSF